MEPDVSGRVGVRNSHIRHHVVATDSGPDLGGFDAGASPVELLFAAIGGCVAHNFMLQAAARRFSFSSLEVEASGVLDLRSGLPGHESTPIHPTDIKIVFRVTSDASIEVVRSAADAAERACPVSAALNPAISIGLEIELTSAH
jgi:uncharacterized OsmC-like protein